jgi:hypothetical protein
MRNMTELNFHEQNGRLFCDDCGAEVTPEWGKQCRDPGEPISATQSAYILYCGECKSAKGQWSTRDERDATVGAMLKTRLAHP